MNGVFLSAETDFWNSFTVCLSAGVYSVGVATHM